MSHPFELDVSELEFIELDFEEELTDEEAATVEGAISAANPRLGEHGGCIILPPIKHPHPIKPPTVTTQAIGEEGGEIIYTTLALGEEGGGGASGGELAL